MLQLTQSLYKNHISDIPISGDGEKQKESFRSEKLYTQSEVNDLIKKKDESIYSQEREVEVEIQNANKQKRSDIKTVAKLVKKSNRILVSISSHAFPFDIFPDCLTVEEGRITIIKRHFLSSEVHSIDIKDISNIFINRTFIFSQLVFVSKTYEENEIRMRNLRTKDAIFVRRIIEGLRIFADKQIDTCIYTKKELIAKLEELSTTEIVT
jgi:hypothetical protein